MLERLLVFLVWVVVLLAAALASGARERRSLGLPWGRWLTTTALIVVCATAPGVPAVLLGVRPSGLVRTWVVEDGDEPPIELVEDLRVGTLAQLPDDGVIHSWAARAAAVSGKLEAAARHMACASRLAQGDAAAELAAVAVAAAQRDRGAAQAALERARAAVARQPLAFLERDFSDLERAVHSL